MSSLPKTQASPWDRPAVAQELDDRLARLIAMAAVLEKEASDLGFLCQGLGVNWTSNLESLLEHLSTDLKWIRIEIDDLRG